MKEYANAVFLPVSILHHGRSRPLICVKVIPDAGALLRLSFIVSLSLPQAKSSSSPLPSAPTSPSGSKTTTSGEQPPTFAPAGDTWNASNNLLVWPPPLTTGFEASDNQVAFVCDPLTNQVTTMMLIAPMMHQQPPFTAFPPPNTMPDVTSSRMDVLADGSGDSGCQALSQQVLRRLPDDASVILTSVSMYQMKEDHDDGVVALQQSMNDLDLNTSNTSNDCRGSSGVCGSGPGHHRRPLFNRSSQFGDRQRRASVNFTGAPNKSDDQVRFKISPFVSGRESLRRLPTGFPDPRIMARRKPFIRRTFGTRHYVRSSTGPSPTGGSGVGNQQQHPHDVSNRLHPLEEGRYQADGHTIAKTSPEE